MPRPTPPHGTDGGYQRHIRLKEPACEACLTAHAETIAQQRERNGATRRKKGPAHGTRAAYLREQRAFKAGRGPEPCAACRAANAEWAAERRSRVSSG